MTLTLSSFLAKNGQKMGQNANFSNILVWNPWRYSQNHCFYMKVHSLILILFYELFSISIGYWMATNFRKVVIFGIFSPKNDPWPWPRGHRSALIVTIVEEYLDTKGKTYHAKYFSNPSISFWKIVHENSKKRKFLPDLRMCYHGNGWRKYFVTSSFASLSN